jgi:uncharacterized membrane protein YphA (DoxX/SURF4 family)
MLVSRELNAAYWALRIAFGLGPLLAGLDKFRNFLVNWEKYLSPRIQPYLPMSATSFMHIVGGIEIIVGLAILFSGSRVFAYIAALWLFGIAVNLISTGTYYDIAVRDILLGLSAYGFASGRGSSLSAVMVRAHVFHLRRASSLSAGRIRSALS